MIQAVGLISCGVPFDTAFALAEIAALGDPIALAMQVLFGQQKGLTMDWERMELYSPDHP